MTRSLCRGVGSALLLASLASCQAVLDFDESRICAGNTGFPIDCEERSRLPAGVSSTCAIGTCLESSGRCSYEPDPLAQGMPCDTGDPCEQGATCVGVSCVGTRADDGDACTPRTPTGEPGSVDPCRPGTCQSGACVVTLLPEGAPCMNDNICQLDDTKVCVRVERDGVVQTECIGDPDPASQFELCDDGNPCTVDTACVNGNCSGSNVMCPDGEVCDRETGDCVPVEVEDPT